MATSVMKRTSIQLWNLDVMDNSMILSRVDKHSHRKELHILSITFLTQLILCIVIKYSIEI
jgi:hypothetical protein